MSNNLDLGGNDLIVSSISVGATMPGQSGTKLSDIANVVTTDQNQTITGVKTFTGNPTFTTGSTLKANAGTSTLVSNAATVTKYASQITTESLTTAAGASQALTLTLTGVAATDVAFVTRAGGTNTRHNFQYDVVCTTNTITVTVFNTEPTNALNGTLIFNLWVFKA